MENLLSLKRAGAVLFLEFFPAIVDPENMSQTVLVQRKVMKSSTLELTTLEYALKRRAFGCDYLIGCMLSHDLISHISVRSRSQAVSWLIAIVIILLKMAAKDAVKRSKRATYKEYIYAIIIRTESKQQGQDIKGVTAKKPIPYQINHRALIMEVFPGLKGKKSFNFTIDQCNESTLLLLKTSLMCVSIWSFETVILVLLLFLQII